MTTFRVATRRRLPTLLALCCLGLLAGCAPNARKEAPWYLSADPELYGQLRYWPREEAGSDSGTQCVPASLLNPEALGYRTDDTAGDLWDRVREGYGMDGSVDERRVDRQVGQFTSRQRLFDALGTNASPYLRYVVGELESRKMPLELALLPVVESSYNPGATSRSQAAGIWQIIPGTGKKMGLEQNSWYDGRRDVVASTEAALDYLAALHDRFDGDWYLALAAYNAGEGSVDRAIERNKRLGKPTDYWSLPLSQQACDYVPKLLALSRVLENPDDHDISLAPIPDRAMVAEVTVDSRIDLRRAATEAGMDSGELLRLNQAVRRGVTGPTGTTTILVPVENRDRFLAALDSLPEASAPIRSQYRVRKGDNLRSIARLHQTSAETLRDLNGLKSDRIVAGEFLQLPEDAVLPPQEFPTTASVELRKHGVYRVRPGDNLWRIARAQGVDAATLARLNGLSPDSVLQPGQRLQLRAAVDRSPRVAAPQKVASSALAAPLKAAATPKKVASPAAMALVSEQQAGTRRIDYTVRPGDSLYRIAGRHKVDLNQLMAWNGIDTRRPLIHAGQSLVVYVDAVLAAGTGAI